MAELAIKSVAYRQKKEGDIKFLVERLETRASHFVELEDIETAILLLEASKLIREAL